MLNHKKIEKVLLIILECLTYLSFFMPFIFLSNTIFPFIVGKLLFFQGLVQIMAVIYVLLLFLNFKQFKPKKNLLLIWFGIYALGLLVSAIFGVDFSRSFWSNFERMTGVFVVWHFIAYAIIVSITFNTWLKIKRAIQVLLGVSLLQAGVVAAQYMKPGVFLYANVGGRVWGTLGNSIYIGSYFLFHIFFALLLAFKEKKQVWQIAYLSIAMLEAYIIVHSRSSRGADLALISALIFILFAYGILSRNKKIKIFTIIFSISCVILLGGIVSFRKSDFIQKMPLVGNLANMSLQEGTGRTRAIAWEIAIKSFKERPILGVGLENFYYVFNKYYNPESLRYSYYETWFDRSHSIIFDALATGGIVGFISYFGLFAAGAVLLFKTWKKNLADKHILIFFPVIFGTYLIQNLFVFDHPGSYLLFYFSFGLFLAVLANSREDYAEPKYNFTKSGFLTAGGFLGIIFLILFFTTSIRTLKAATGVIDAEKEYANNYKAGMEKYKELLKMKTPFLHDMRSTMAKRVARVNQGVLQSYPDYAQALKFARSELLEETNKGSVDVYDYIILGQIDTLLAETDKNYLSSAEGFFKKARELSPKRQQIFYTWARTKIMANDLAGAEKLLKEAAEFDLEISDSYWYLGLLYSQEGKKEAAWIYFMKAIDKGYAWKDIQEPLYLIGIGEDLKKYNELPQVYLAAISLNPAADLYAGLGKVYYNLGDKDKTSDAFQKAEQLDPKIFKK